MSLSRDEVFFHKYLIIFFNIVVLLLQLKSILDDALMIRGNIMFQEFRHFVHKIMGKVDSSYHWYDSIHRTLIIIWLYHFVRAVLKFKLN